MKKRVLILLGLLLTVFIINFVNACNSNSNIIELKGAFETYKDKIFYENLSISGSGRGFGYPDYYPNISHISERLRVYNSEIYPKTLNLSEEDIKIISNFYSEGYSIKEQTDVEYELFLKQVKKINKRWFCGEIYGKILREGRWTAYSMIKKQRNIFFMKCDYPVAMC